MQATDQIAVTVWDSAPFALMAQIRDMRGNLLTLANTATVNRKVIAAGESEPTSDETIEPADCIQATLQRDYPWAIVAPFDPVGYNFRHVLSINTPGTWRIVYAITDTDGGVAVLDVLATVKDRP